MIDASTSPPIRQFGPIVTPPRRLARNSCVSRPIVLGPSIRVKGCTQAPAAIVIGPLVVSKTVKGSIRAVAWMKSRSARTPRSVGDRRVRIAGPLAPLQIGPEHHAAAERSRPDPERLRDLRAQRARAQQQVEHRSRQGQRMETNDGIVLDQAETHR